ncbi:hypothetical protein CsSME_00008652 [Camellia sinensis var. sinensis]
MLSLSEICIRRSELTGSFIYSAIGTHESECFCEIQGQTENGKPPRQGVRDRCRSEWAQFQDRLADADKAYLAHIPI